jgi:hypothetical protein
LFRLNLDLHYSLSSDLKPRTSQLIDRLFDVIIRNNCQGGIKLDRSNHKFNKRQKELARKEKRELKRQRKLNKNVIKSEENPTQSQSDGENI